MTIEELFGGITLDAAPAKLREVAARKRIQAPKTGERDARIFEILAGALEELSSEDRAEAQVLLQTAIDAASACYVWAKPRAKGLFESMGS